MPTCTWSMQLVNGQNWAVAYIHPSVPVAPCARRRPCLLTVCGGPPRRPKALLLRPLSAWDTDEQEHGTYSDVEFLGCGLKRSRGQAPTQSLMLVWVPFDSPRRNRLNYVLDDTPSFSHLASFTRNVFSMCSNFDTIQTTVD